MSPLRQGVVIVALLLLLLAVIYYENWEPHPQEPALTPVVGCVTLNEYLVENVRERQLPGLLVAIEQNCGEVVYLRQGADRPTDWVVVWRKSKLD